MISEMFIKKYGGSKGLRVVIYPSGTSIKARIYDDPSKASRLRLERIMRKEGSYVYMHRNAITVWMKR